MTRMEQDNGQRIRTLFSFFEAPLLEELVKESILKEVKEGEEIIRPGQFITSSVLLLSGLLKIYRQDKEGSEFLMYFLEPGNACALSMMCSARTEQSQILAQAMSDSEIILIPTHVAERWLIKYPSWHNFVISTYRQRFEELLETLDSVAFKSLDERLLFYLRKHQQVGGNTLKLSHQQIAEELNSSREVISRLLKKLEQRGALTLHRSFIEIHHLDKF